MKVMRRILTVVLCLMMALATISPASAADVAKGADTKLYVDSKNVEPGETFEVTIYLENITLPDGAIGCDIPLQYDASHLELVKVECIFPEQWDSFGLSLCKNPAVNGENPFWLRCVCNAKDLLVNKNRNIKEDKAIGFIATFKAKKPGSTIIQTLEKVGYQTAYVVNADKKVTNYGLNTDSVTITVAGKLGDINDDGYVDSYDAYLALRCNAQLDKFSDIQKLMGDVNGDGAVTPLDASLILQYDAGLLSSF